MIKTFLYGFVWLILLSPYTIFLVLGYMTTQPSPTIVEMIGVITGTGFYWQNIWTPVRSKMWKCDVEFCKMMMWEK